MKKKYLCQKPNSNWTTCKYGGNKYYNNSFLQGTAGYCRFEKKWVCDLKKCPLEGE